MIRRIPLAALALLLVALPLRADVVVFVGGDRMSGKIVAKGTKRVRLKTPYGLLVIPRGKIERLVYPDGREEVLNAPPPPPVPPPPPTTVGLRVLVTGDSFWQAWDPSSVPADPSLRLMVAVDGKEVAAYVDRDLDPADLKGALVNSFVFSPEHLAVVPAAGVKAAPPQPGPDGVTLVLDLPTDLAGPRRLAFTYQVNDATAAAPEWRDVVSADLDIDVVSGPGHETRVRLEQDRGEMEYGRKTLKFGRKSMQRVETFRVVARPGSPGSSPP
jgi:hypothetical protein